MGEFFGPTGHLGGDLVGGVRRCGWLNLLAIGQGGKETGIGGTFIGAWAVYDKERASASSISYGILIWWGTAR